MKKMAWIEHADNISGVASHDFMWSQSSAAGAGLSGRICGRPGRGFTSMPASNLPEQIGAHERDTVPMVLCSCWPGSEHKGGETARSILPSRVPGKACRGHFQEMPFQEGLPTPKLAAAEPKNTGDRLPRCTAHSPTRHWPRPAARDIIPKLLIVNRPHQRIQTVESHRTSLASLPWLRPLRRCKGGDFRSKRSYTPLEIHNRWAVHGTGVDAQHVLDLVQRS